MSEPLGNFPDYALVGNHADLDGVNADIVKNGVDLSFDDFLVNVLDHGHAAGILGGNGRDDAHPVGSEGGKGLEIRLYAGSAA